MTCIIGMVEKGKMYMGADSVGSNGDSEEVRDDPKVFEKGNMLIGFTTSYRMGQLLQYKLIVPQHPQEMDIMKYMVTRFIESVRKCLRAGGYSSKTNEVDKGGIFLVGYQNKIFRIDYDFQVGISFLPFNSVGCGEAYAKGALWAMKSGGMSPNRKILKALEAAEMFSSGVRGPFRVLEK